MNVLDGILSLPARVNRAIDNWLTGPEVNAAGRMGLFRIVFGLFLLWQASLEYYSIAAQTPVLAWKPILILQGIRTADIFTPLFYQATEAAFVLFIVLLIVGYRVRLVTVMVFILGFALEALRLSYGRVEHGSVFASFYIPLFMVMSHWGDTYSIDAILKARRGEPPVSPKDPSGRYIWPMRALLILLVFLFFTAAYYKWTGPSWTKNPKAFTNLLLKENVEVTSEGAQPSVLLVLLAQNPITSGGLRLMTLFFEGLFFLSLFGRRLRNFFVCMALIFHAANALLLYVSFTFLAIIYAVFVDWQHYYERWWPERLKLRLDGIPSGRLVAGTLVFALAFALLWTASPFFRGIFSLGQRIDWRSFWWLVLPFAVIGLIRSSWGLVTGALGNLRGARQRLTRRSLAAEG